jgi:hypothetical protein
MLFLASSHEKPIAIGRALAISGRALLRVALRRGTRILDLRPKPDWKVLAALRKEFGAPIMNVHQSEESWLVFYRLDW